MLLWRALKMTEKLGFKVRKSNEVCIDLRVKRK